MLRKTITYTIHVFFYFFLLNTLQAQVSDIKISAEQNANNNDSDNNNAVAASVIWDIAWQLFAWAPELQVQQLSRKELFPEIISLELMPHVGFGLSPTGNFLLTPRIRGNWGLFSGEVRYTQLAEVGTYSTLDWQVLFNVVNQREATLRLGSGIMSEFHTKNLFVEHFFGLDVRWTRDKRLSSNFEFRFTPDYGRSEMVRLEGNVRLNYRIFDWGRLEGFWTVGAIFQKYYRDTNIWLAQTGMTFNLH